ncbi:MAG: hypothetical protein OEZ34_11725 [Spirochaetia bacterium]|nr:hypothetical protein [Spirochaetia bacterium]
MKILLLTGIQEELTPLFKIHPFEFDRHSRFYRSIEVPEIIAGTTGPGVKRKRDLEKLLEYFIPDVIINAGLVGILNDDDPIKVGDLLKVGNVLDSKTEKIYPGGPGKDTIVTVDHPIFQPWEKMDLHMQFDRARACDMEAANLLKFIGSLDHISKHTDIIFCKVAGDKPESYLLYEHEHLVRNWNKKSFLEKVKTSFVFPGGPARLARLLNEKDNALKSLTKHINNTITRLLILKHIPPNMHSVFIPH